jgi:hypothetical protein
MAKVSKYPGYRTMTAAQRYNARKDRIFEEARQRGDWPKEGDEAMTPTKSPGQLAYEADCASEPLYHDGRARRTWDQLCAVARWSWERNPTTRHGGAADNRQLRI